MPGRARAVGRESSASRDTPCLEYAYGPRPQVTVGAEIGLVAIRFGRGPSPDAMLRFGLYGAIALENAAGKRIFPPSQLWRGLAGTGASLELPSLGRWLGRSDEATFEASLWVGHESDHADRYYEGHEPYRPGDLPYGGGGNWVVPDVALRTLIGQKLEVMTRLQVRVFWNTFAWIGGRRPADAVAAALKDALILSPAADVVLRWRIGDAFKWTLSLFAEALVSGRSEYRDGGLLRVMTGPAWTSAHGEMVPFVSVEGGRGKGLLVGRDELRASVGLRIAAF